MSEERLCTGGSGRRELPCIPRELILKAAWHGKLTGPAPLIQDDEDAGEAQALAVAIAQSDANPRTAPREEVRAWLLRTASGQFETPAA